MKTVRDYEVIFKEVKRSIISDSDLWNEIELSREISELTEFLNEINSDIYEIENRTISRS